MTDPETFARRLTRLREAAGLSRYAAAKAAGISAIGYTRYETKGVVPSLPAAERLAAALGVTLADLAGCHWPSKWGG